MKRSTHFIRFLSSKVDIPKSRFKNSPFKLHLKTMIIIIIQTTYCINTLKTNITAALNYLYALINFRNRTGPVGHINCFKILPKFDIFQLCKRLTKTGIVRLCIKLIETITIPFFVNMN